MSRIIGEDIKRIAEDIGPSVGRLSGKTLLITGGTGFLGRYILRTLVHLNRNVLEKPCKVISLDNSITGLKNVGVEDPSLVLVTHDVRDPIRINEKIDFIVHAAGIGSPVFYNRYKLETIDVGAMGTRNMLELAKEKNVESFLFFSSSEVYGDPDPRFVPTPETYSGNVSPIGPRACYDESKRIGETYCINYFHVYNIPVKILRPFNVYGPGMRLDDYRVIPNFMSKAFGGEDLPVYGDGRNTRTFCYISDFTAGFFKVLLSDSNGHVFNIGNPNGEISMHELAKMVAGMFSNVGVKFVTGPNETYTTADPKRRCPDITKIKTLTGFEPKVDLAAGLNRFAEWVKETNQSSRTN